MTLSPQTQKLPRLSNIYPILSNIKWHYNWHYNLYNLLLLSREWMGCWGLLGWLLRVSQWSIPENSVHLASVRQVGGFGTCFLFFHILRMSSSQLTFTPSFFRGVGEKPPSRFGCEQKKTFRSDLVTDSSWTECLRAAKLCTRKLTFRFPARSG